MMRWGSGHMPSGGMTKPAEPVTESIPSQDVNNLQPDEQGFYTISFTNDDHFSSFEVFGSAYIQGTFTFKDSLQLSEWCM